jgi:hypothetical protein
LHTYRICNTEIWRIKVENLCPYTETLCNILVGPTPKYGSETMGMGQQEGKEKGGERERVTEREKTDGWTANINFLRFSWIYTMT